MSFAPEDYERIREGCKRSAAAVVPTVYDLVKPETVVDVGGGEGWWAREFAINHDCACLVMDEAEMATASDQAVFPTEVTRHSVDLSADQIDVLAPPSGRFDLALCLEVAEHLPEEDASGLIAMLVQLAPVVLFSAAIPNQGGHGHINEQWPAYWRKLFAAHDFSVTDCLRWRFWDDDRVEPWYRQNMLLAAKVETLCELLQSVEWHLGCPAVVHPDIYGWRVEERDRLNRILYPS